MKKIFGLLLALVLALNCLPLAARADVIAWPDDSFFEEHSDECEYVNRSYLAAGPNGNVTVYESPESDKEEYVAENGQELLISYIYTDDRGVVWGCWENWGENYFVGWVPMEYLELIYDSIAFEEDFGHLFEEVEGTLEPTDQEVYFWSYPGSDRYVKFIVDAEYLPEYYHTYTDENGKTWAYCNYYMGLRNVWIYLEDPTEDLTASMPVIPVPDETEGPAIPDATEPTVEIKPETKGPDLSVVFWVAVLVAATAKLLMMLKKKEN